MKKKFLIPVLGLFVMALAFSFNNSSSSSSSSDELAGLFINSDNIAFAEGQQCGYLLNAICVTTSGATWNSEYCN
jgi:hypothetical protein